MLYENGWFYWYGQALRPLPAAPRGKGGQTTTEGVVMYRSRDLGTWENLGVILSVSSDPKSPLYAPMRFERPKIHRNPKTGKYVLWCHYVAFPGDHGEIPGSAEAGCAVSDTIYGPYTWLGTVRPISEAGLVRDCTVFQDDDGRGYFIFDRQTAKDNRCQHIVELCEDYLSMTDHYRRLDEIFWREAASPLHYQGTYYMFTSGLTSWTANPARLYRSKDLFGPWEDMGDPCRDDMEHNTFFSQSTFVFAVPGALNADGDPLFVRMAERHNTENFLHCSYIWLPVYFRSGSAELVYEPEWTIRF